MEEVDSVKQEKAKYYKSFHDIYNAIDKLYESYSNEYNIFAGEDDYNNKLVNKFCLSEYNNISTTFKNLPKDEQHGYNEELYNKICDMLQECPFDGGFFYIEEVDSVKQEKAKSYKSFHDIYNAINELYESHRREYKIFAGEGDYDNKLLNKFCLSEYNNISTTFKNLPKDEQHGYNEELYNKICDMLQECPFD